MLDLNFKLYLVVNTRLSYKSKLYPLQAVQDYEIYTQEEIDIQDAVDTLETIYLTAVDEDGNIYFRAELEE